MHLLDLHVNQYTSPPFRYYKALEKKYVARPREMNTEYSGDFCATCLSDFRQPNQYSSFNIMSFKCYITKCKSRCLKQRMKCISLMDSSVHWLCMELFYLSLLFSLQWQRRKPPPGPLPHQHFWTREGNYFLDLGILSMLLFSVNI